MRSDHHIRYKDYKGDIHHDLDDEKPHDPDFIVVAKDILSLLSPGNPYNSTILTSIKHDDRMTFIGAFYYLPSNAKTRSPTLLWQKMCTAYWEIKIVGDNCLLPVLSI